MKEEFKFDKKEFLNDLEKLVSVKSFLNDAEDYPNTPVMGEALDVFCELGKKHGFRTFKDKKNRYGFAEIGKEKAPIIAILGHLDVVPPGNLKKWETDPFKIKVVDNMVYGRGVIDDKGPVVLLMHIVSQLKKNNIDLKNKRIRIIVGTDEETLWRGIPAYNKNEEAPLVGFTPDSGFPLTFAEKELFLYKITGNGSNLDLKLGGAFNAVPGEIIYKGQDIEKIIQGIDSKDFKVSDDGKELVVFGKEAHAARLEQGKNALITFVKGLENVDSNNNIIKFLNEKVGTDPNAKKIFGDLKDDISGSLTFNVAKLNLNKNNSETYVDSRVPVTRDGEQVVKTLKKSLEEYNLKLEVFDHLPKVYAEKDSKLVTILMEIYKKHTLDIKAEPLVSGGATYARAIQNCLAFGPKFSFEKSTEHKPNEEMNLDNFETASKIYYDALIKLLDLKQ